MNIFDTLRISWLSITANKARSALTVLGIVIGIVSIVLVMSLGAGAKAYILSQVEGIGAHTIIVRPGRQPKGPTDVAESILSDSLKQRDIELLKSSVPGIISLEPVVIVPGGVAYQNQVSRPTIFGWTSQALGRFFSIYPTEGDFFTDDDIKNHAKVAVIGHKVKDELFSDSDAVGESIKIRGQSMRVVGVLPAKGQVSVLNLDEVVVIPYTVAQKDILGINFYHEVFIGVADNVDMDTVTEDIKAILRDAHGITDPAKDDFFLVTQQDVIDRVSGITRALTIFLTGIASISLLVGGVGIMNIMLVSVTERTKEIGLRKALGATNRDILQQFLLEALTLTIGGGVVGVLTATVLAYAVALAVKYYGGLEWKFELPILSVVLGVGMAAIIGVVFGLYPARKAAQKDPIEALRYE